MKLLFLLILASPFFLIAQSETEKWEKSDHIYEIKSSQHSHQEQSSGSSVTSSFVSVYKFFISDIDGDNCAFNPSCSSFFSEAADEVGFISGVLLFADRLTRDFNPAGRDENYQYKINGRYSDPVSRYISFNSRR
ncbi:MAG: membrane protein insertion efficiency factor YidD [Ignavibacteriales bacterium]|nr:MAG: membrane protein insertion efficiency factor YidD [Ignavibacteriales bacterium]